MRYKKDFQGILDDLKTINPRGFEMIVFTDAPSIGFIRRNHGEDSITKVLCIMLGWLCDQLSIGKNMSGDQILTASEIIIDKFHQLTPMDLKLCFKRALAGDYGTIYDRLDVVVVCEWLKKYFDERNSFAEMEQLKKHKAIEDRKKIDPISDEAFENNIKPLFDKFKVMKNSKTVKEHKITPIQKLVGRWADQFDVLHESIGDQTRFKIVSGFRHGIKILIIDNGWMDKSTFIAYKQSKESNLKKLQEANLDSI